VRGAIQNYIKRSYIEIKKEYASGNHALLIGDEAKNDYENEIFKRYFL